MTKKKYWNNFFWDPELKTKMFTTTTEIRQSTEGSRWQHCRGKHGLYYITVGQLDTHVGKINMEPDFTPYK